MGEINPPYALQNAGATHTAEGDRNMLNGLVARAGTAGSMLSVGGVNMGIGSAFSTTQTGSPSMAVNVASGIAYVPGTEGAKQGVYCCVNDGSVSKTISAAHGTLPRIDSIIARVYDSAYSGVTNTWAIEVLTGTAASSPVAPTLPANSIRLFNISVGAAVSSIVQANISDVRTSLIMAGGIIPTTTAGKTALLPLVPEGQAIWLQDTGIMQFKWSSAFVTRSTSNVIQSGTFNVTFTNKSNHTINWTFPTAFTSTPRVATNINSGAGEAVRWTSRAFNITTTSATMLLYSPDAATLADWTNIPVQWIAVQ